MNLQRTNPSSYGELRYLLREMPVDSTLVIPWSARNQEVVGHFRDAGEFLFVTRKIEKGTGLLVTKYTAPKDLLGDHFVYFSKKLRAFPPKYILSLGRLELDKLLDGDKLLRSFDHPFIQQGFYHDALFLEDGSLDEQEFSRISKIFESITGTTYV